MTSPGGRRSKLAAAFAIFAMLAAACGGGDDDDDAGYDVESSTVSHETTQDIRVFEPDAEGSWPVVFALHGINGSSEHMAELGRRLAQQGILVFAPDYRTDVTTPEGQVDLVRDVECAYRFTRTIAADHGGDLDQPVAFVGWSLGATFAIQGSLVEEVDPSGEFVSCFEEVPRPDVVVAISGCHYQVPANLFDSNEWTNEPAEILLVAGDEDTSCPASQTEDAATELRTAGYDVDLVTLQGADHSAPVFYDMVGDDMVPSADEPAGERVVELIRDTIEEASDS